MADVLVTVRADWLLPALEDSSRRGVERAAIAAIAMIRQRTARGVDAGGRSFVPYSRTYRNRKMATGRDSGTVDLTLTGEMLRCMNVLRVETNPLRCVVGFSQETHRVVRFSRAGRKAKFSNRDSKRTIRARRLKHGDATVPMAKVVQGNMARRRFFDIVRDDEKAKLVEIIRREIRAGLREKHPST